jgi:hypothetical protein
MQNDISNKVRLLLNELAILNQPDLIEGKFFYHADTLRRVQQLSAELYLLSDQLRGNVAAPLSEPAPHEEKTEPVAEKILEVPVVTPPEPILVPEPIVVEPLPQIVEAEPVAIPTPVEVPAAEIKHEPVTPPPVNTGAVDVFDGKISFTRRFEYVNSLFGGDSGAFSAFLHEISAAGNREAAMHIFESAFEQRQWKRKSETADDLKLLIKKVK